jgi:L-iditol 2-dehydrogenase
MPKFKQALVWPGKVEVVEKDLPEIKDNEILVRIELSGICGTDAHVFEKGYGPHRISGSATYPLSLGHEYVGVIEKKGKDADKYMNYRTEIPDVGDRIYWGLDMYNPLDDFNMLLPGWQQWAFVGTYGFAPPETGFWGGWGQYVILKPGTYIWRLPKEKISPEKGVVIEPYIVGLRAADKLLTMLAISEKEANPSTDVVAIYGAGAIGLATLTALKAASPFIVTIVLDPNDHRLDKAKELGADYVINVRKTSREERIEKIKDIVAKHSPYRLGERWGVDGVVNCTGKNSEVVIPEGIEILRPMGVFVEVGSFTYRTAGTFTLDPHEICSRELIFVGNWAYPLSTINKGVMQVRAGLFDKIPYHTIITHKHKLEPDDIVRGINDLLRGVGIKHVIDPWL